MMDKIQELPPIGKSDHLCQKWEVTVKEAIYKNNSVMRPNFKRANWTQIKDDFDQFTFESNAEVGDMMDDLLSTINNTKKSNIPLCKPRSVKTSSPMDERNEDKASTDEKMEKLE